MDVKQGKFLGEIMSLKTDLSAECDGVSGILAQGVELRGSPESSRQWLKQSAAQMGRTWS